MRFSRFVASACAVAALAACSPEKSPSAEGPTVAPSSSSPAVSASAASPSAASPSVTPTPPKPTPPKPTPPKPTVTPTPPKPTPLPGVVLTAKNAYLQPSEDENLTQPDFENGCEVHDPDLTQVECGVVNMAGGIATWVTGREQNTLPGADEPRVVVRIYQRLKNGSDSLTYVGIGEPGVWAHVDVRVGSLTGQVRDSLVVVVTMRGSGTYAGYDVVTWRAAAPLKLMAHHPEGSHAQIFVRSKGYISTYVADYSDGSPNCCPKVWQHDNVRWYAPHFRLVKLKNVSSPPSG